jgi:predicted phage-related endonuclease
VTGEERETYSYVLIGGNNLQEHLGKRVEVTGTIVGGEKEIEHEAEKKTQQPDATGSGDKPTVKTQEEVEVEVRQLNVLNVRTVAGNCQLTQ